MERNPKGCLKIKKGYKFLNAKKSSSNFHLTTPKPRSNPSNLHCGPPPRFPTTWTSSSSLGTMPQSLRSTFRGLWSCLDLEGAFVRFEKGGKSSGNRNWSRQKFSNTTARLPQRTTRLRSNCPTSKDPGSSGSRTTLMRHKTRRTWN